MKLLLSSRLLIGLLIIGILSLVIEGTTQPAPTPIPPSHPLNHQVLSVSTPPRLYLLDPALLAAAKAKLHDHTSWQYTAYLALLKNANHLLTTTPPSVMDKQQTPPSGDKHDYYSIAPYTWPNPHTPTGLPYIGRDGQVDPLNEQITDQTNLQKMISTVRLLSLAYYFSGDERYAQKAVAFLKVWFINPTSRMNPNLTYAQLIPGRDPNVPSGIIDTWTLPQLLDSLSLLSDSAAFRKTDQQQMTDWFSAYYHWLTTSPQGRREQQDSNNRGTWYDVQAVSIALYLGNSQAAEAVLQQAKQKDIVQKITPDGSQPQELKRTRAWDYSNFNLQALFDLASLADKEHIDLWHYQTSDGRSIRQSLSFLLPYLEGKPWPYHQITAFNTNGLKSMLLHGAVVYHDTTYWQLATQQNPAIHSSLDMLLYPQ